MTRAFYYGLFMDPDRLAELGFHPEVVGPARLDGFELRIGNLSALIAAPGAASFGMLIDLPGEEVDALYAQPSVADYRPEEVDAVLLADGSVHRCACYNLPAGELGSGVNRTYAESLASLVQRLGFPEDYAEHIRVQGRA